MFELREEGYILLMSKMTRKQAIKIIATSMVKANGGSITYAQAVKGLGPWYSDERLVETASQIKGDK